MKNVTAPDARKILKSELSPMLQADTSVNCNRELFPVQIWKLRQSERIRRKPDSRPHCNPGSFRYAVEKKEKSVRKRQPGSAVFQNFLKHILEHGYLFAVKRTSPAGERTADLIRNILCLFVKLLSLISQFYNSDPFILPAP